MLTTRPIGAFMKCLRYEKAADCLSQDRDAGAKSWRRLDGHISV